MTSIQQNDTKGYIHPVTSNYNKHSKYKILNDNTTSFYQDNTVTPIYKKVNENTKNTCEHCKKEYYYVCSCTNKK